MQRHLGYEFRACLLISSSSIWFSTFGELIKSMQICLLATHIGIDIAWFTVFCSIVYTTSIWRKSSYRTFYSLVSISSTTFSLPWRLDFNIYSTDIIYKLEYVLYYIYMKMLWKVQSWSLIFTLDFGSTCGHFTKFPFYWYSKWP